MKPVDVSDLFCTIGTTAREMRRLGGIPEPGPVEQAMSQMGSLSCGPSLEEIVERKLKERDAARAAAQEKRHFLVGDRVRVVRDARGRDRGEAVLGRTGIVKAVFGDEVEVRLEGAGFFSREMFHFSDLEWAECVDETTASGSPVQPVQAESFEEFARHCGVPGLLPEPQETWAATLELAGGRLVEIPGPDPAVWDLAEEQRWEAAENLRVRVRPNVFESGDVELRYLRPVEDSRFSGGIVLLSHDAARCWAHDMARVVNEQGPLGGDPRERGALLRSLRTYRRRPPVDPHADRPYPALRAYLW